MGQFLPKNLLKSVLSIPLLLSLWSPNASAVSMALGAAPDNNQEVLLKAIEVASREIIMNVYELNSRIVANAIVMKIKQGVRVSILIEGQPVGGFQAKTKAAVDYIVGAMKQADMQATMNRVPNYVPHSFHIMSGVNGNKRRFRFNHAKYTLIDRQDVVMGSENYSDSGHPRKGAQGNRGWEVLIRSPELAMTLLKMFVVDDDPKYGDIVDAKQMGTEAQLGQILGGSMGMFGANGFAGMFDNELPEIDGFYNINDPWQFVHNTPIRTTDGQIIDIVRSPDTSLPGIIRLMRSAQRTMDVQLMSFNGIWGMGVSPFLTELRDAAKRGVRVRVMLNDDSVFSRGEPRPNGNTRTLNQLNQMGQGIPLTAIVASNKKLNINYIHNKGIVVDGNTALISSINWTQNSVTNNRETALVLRGAEVGQYYGFLFEKDWQAAQSTVQGQ